MRDTLLCALLILAAFLASPAPTTAQQANLYLQTFEGSPGAPQPYDSSQLDLTYHIRDISARDNFPPMDAAHGADCAGPPATHPIGGSPEDSFFLCRDHLMTAIHSAGWGTLAMTPVAILDFSAGEAVVRFDVSTLATSNRDWIELWLQPFDSNLQIWLPKFSPDLTAGPPQRALRIFGQNRPLQTTPKPTQGFGFERYDNYAPVKVPAWHCCLNLLDWLTTSASRRDTFELRVSRTHLSFGMPSIMGKERVWADGAMADLGWDRALVTFAHESYSPEKDGGQADSWHWDNLSLQPATFPLYARGIPRLIESTNPEQLVEFPQPAPSSAWLRFVAVGASPELSFDDGATWEAARVQPYGPQPQGKALDPGYALSYLHPMPEGAKSIRFRASGGWWGRTWYAADFSWWAGV